MTQRLLSYLRCDASLLSFFGKAEEAEKKEDC
jgi:hypothetical protein